MSINLFLGRHHAGAAVQTYTQSWAVVDMAGLEVVIRKITIGRAVRAGIGGRTAGAIKAVLSVRALAILHIAVGRLIGVEAARAWASLVTRPGAVAVIARAAWASAIARLQGVGVKRPVILALAHRAWPTVTKAGALAVATATWASVAVATARATCASSTRAFALTHTLQHFSTGGTRRSSHYVTAWGAAQAAPQGLTAHGNRFGTFTFVGAKAFYGVAWQGLFGKQFDLGHKAFFVQTHQVYRFA